MSQDPRPRPRTVPPSSPPPEAPPVAARAQELFRELAEALESGPVDVESFLARHPDQAADLRALHAGWLRAQSLLVGLVSDARVAESALDALAPRPPDAGRDAERLLALQELQPRRPRYEPVERIGQGGMGVVHRVRDRALGRELAMKSMRADRAHRARFLRRFLDEAAVLGRLEHPGVPPVHELGVDERGQPFFTMPLVRGRSLGEVFELAWNAREGWSTARVLEVLLRVCDTLAYAHSQGVVHRDLKPANVMVGRFGETYVMDWGLARHAAPGAPAGGLDDEHARAAAAPRAAARAEGDADAEESLSPVHTLEGEVLGTPAYMAPEQARGEQEAVGPATDVYSLGAILYHFLAHRAPYARSGEPQKTREVLERVRSAPPEALATLAPHAPPELVAIAERAMARESARRYADVRALSDDLRAYVEGRVVRAHERGVWAELRKWLRRNRRLAAASASAVIAVLAGLAAVIVVRAREVERTQREADLRGPAALAARAEELWPATEELAPAMEAWIAEARELVGRREHYVRALAALRTRGRPLAQDAPEAAAERRRTEQRMFELEYHARGIADDRGQIDRYEGTQGWREANAEWDARLAEDAREVEALRARLARPAAWTYAEAEDGRLDHALERLLAELDDLASPDLHRPTIAALAARLERARSLRLRTLVDAADAWRDAIRSIADRATSPLYDGLILRPQRGLVPLGRDAGSGLWEFWPPDTGDRPERGADGAWLLRPETGLVLVLVPGGEAWVGNDEPLPWMWDRPGHVDMERPRTRVCLDPYFLSKYEVTQAQWLRWTGENPSYYRPGHVVETSIANALHPVERVTWFEAQRWLARYELGLPTEAQWQHAASAGARTTWPSGDVPETLIGAENQYEGNFSPPWADGFPSTAPVGRFTPSAWGFHDLGGNVSEWTADTFWTCYRWPFRDGDGLQMAPDSGHRSLRGGAYHDDPGGMRASARLERMPDSRMEVYGVRAARAVSDR